MLKPIPEKREVAYQPHDHTHCIKTALTEAEALCLQHKAKFTPLRKTVFELVWQNHQPLGAYELMAQLEAKNGKRVAPPTVYRALEFLQDLGLVHKIASLNAYIGCTQPEHLHPAHFLICKDCGIVQELSQDNTSQALHDAATQHGFTIEHSMVELVGTCPNCIKPQKRQHPQGRASYSPHDDGQ
jgi:Fur family zinc uptake transcriptional regulator